MTNLNIRNEADRAVLEAKGFRYVTVLPRGENKGRVISKHRTYDAANTSAKGRDLQILEIANASMY